MEEGTGFWVWKVKERSMKPWDYLGLVRCVGKGPRIWDLELEVGQGGLRGGSYVGALAGGCVPGSRPSPRAMLTEHIRCGPLALSVPRKMSKAVRVP